MMDDSLAGPETIDSVASFRKLSDREKLDWCLENLGDRITAVALRELSAAGIHAWAEATVSLPSEALPRLNLLYAAGSRVAEALDVETARSFLRSSNPYLGDQSVVMTIRGREKLDEDFADVTGQVAGAVSDFLNR